MSPSERPGAKVRRLAVFAHYDAQDEIKRFIVDYLRALSGECERVLFISTARLSEGELAKIQGLCAEVVLRENIGFDFGMWRDAIERTNLEEWDELVLTNSSVFGPLHPLGPIFERMTSDPCDVWGMTENIEIAWHLQSYFLVFRRSLLRSPVFRQFWSGVLPFKDKNQLIRSYEIGLSRLLLDYGFKLGVAFPTAKLDVPRVPRIAVLRHDGLWTRLRSRRVNPTCGYPVELIQAGMPFVKAEVLRDNPLHAGLEPLLAAMAETGYDMSLVELDRPAKRAGSQKKIAERWVRRG